MPTDYPALQSSPWNLTLKAYIDSLVAESTAGGPFAPLVHTHVSTDITDFEAAVLDIIGGGSGGIVPDFYPEDYGAAADGVTDDGAAIRAATTAAGDAGGGVVRFTGAYAWSGDIGPDRDGVIYRGSGAGDSTNGLIALDSTSRLRIGVWGSGERPGGVFDLVIDGSGTGLATGLVHQQSVWTTMIGVKIMDAAGVGWLIDGAQNSSYISVDTVNNGTNVRLTNGAGGLMFMRCSNAPGAGGKGLVVDDADGSTGNVYPFGSAHIQWTECIFEQHVTGVTDLVRLDCGGLLRFTSCGFSDNDVASGAPELVRVSNDSFPAVTTSVEFESCNFNGGSVNQRPSIRMVDSATRVVISGDTYWQQTSALVLADNAAPSISLLGSFLEGSGTGNLMATVNGGALTNALNQRYLLDDYRLGSTQATVIAARRDTDVSGLRYFLNRDGTHSWSDGTGFSAKQSLGYNTTFDVISASSLLVTGRRMSSITQQNISTAAASVSIDSRINTHEVYLTGSGSVADMTVTDAVQGAEIELWITQDGTGGHTYEWPTDFDWGIDGVPPTDTTADKSVVVRARYRTGFAKWFVLSTNVVSSGGGGTVTSVNGDSGPAVVLDAADVGAATSAQGTLADSAVQPEDLATVATTGDYDDLSNTPVIPRVFEVTTATAAATVAKTATIGGGYAYTDGDLISVIATSGNVAASPTLNIDSLGAKSIFLGGSAVTLYAGVLAANGRWFLRYDSATDRFDLYGVSGNYDLVAQAAMEAGTSTTVGWMNPQRVRQAIQYQIGVRAPNVQTGAYTFVLDDAERVVEHNSGSAADYTIPPSTFPVGTRLYLVQVGTGQATFIQGSGVTIHVSSSAATRAQWSVTSAYQRATNEWVVSGDTQ